MKTIDNDDDDVVFDDNDKKDYGIVDYVIIIDPWRRATTTR